MSEAHYRLYGLETKSQWGAIFFRTHPDWPWGPPSFLQNGYCISFQRISDTYLSAACKTVPCTRTIFPGGKPPSMIPL
jgi:hypothetical protein